MARSVPRWRPGGGDDDQGAAARCRVRPEAMRRARQAMPLGSRLANPDTVPRTQGWQPRKSGKGAGNCRSIACSAVNVAVARDASHRAGRFRRQGGRDAQARTPTTQIDRDLPSSPY